MDDRLEILGAGGLVQGVTLPDVLRTESSITRRRVESICGVSQATAARLLARLVRDGTIVSSGKGPASRYHLP